MNDNRLFHQLNVGKAGLRGLRGARRLPDDLVASRSVRHRLLTPTIARQLSAVIAVLIASMTLGIIFYGEPFRFFRYPLSDLGATKTEHGFSNVLSIIFFDSGMIVSGLIMFSVSSRFAASKVDHRKIKRGLTLLCGIGFFIIIFPYNISDPIHMTGGGAVFGSLWGLTLLFLLELRKEIGAARFWLVQAILQCTVLPYAALFALGQPIKQAFQKPAVVGLMLALRLAIWMRRRLPLIRRSRRLSRLGATASER